MVHRVVNVAVKRLLFCIQTLLNTINSQVAKNMVGFNVSSALTNFVSGVQGFAKSNKFDAVKAFAQTASNKINSIFGKSDGFVENDPTIIRRKGAEKFYRTPIEKVSDVGYTLMSAVDDLTTEFLIRSKYNELTRKRLACAQLVSVNVKNTNVVKWACLAHRSDLWGCTDEVGDSHGGLGLTEAFHDSKSRCFFKLLEHLGVQRLARGSGILDRGKIVL